MDIRYLISYDLLTPGKDYRRLVGELQRLGATKVLFSAWILMSSGTSKQIRDHLMQFIDSNDRMLVGALPTGAAWTTLLTDMPKAA